MKTLIFFLGLFSLSVIINCETNVLFKYFGFNDYELKYNKSYGSKDDEWESFRNYFIVKTAVDVHHDKFIKGLVSFDCALNHLSDLSIAKKQSLNGFAAKNSIKVLSMPLISMKRLETPESIDWRTNGTVTPVQDQGYSCSSCWAFSALGALEGQIFKQTGSLEKLSEQNLVDCNTITNFGCLGGLMISAFEYIINNHGIAPNSIYPYEGVDQPCKFNNTRFTARAASYMQLTPGDELQLAHAISTIGPISVAMDASLDTFFSYTSGVYYDQRCLSFNLNHAVLIVGYGTDIRWGDYWLVKNSWGTTWGEEGYFKIARNRGNHCGIASYIVYPIL